MKTEKEIQDHYNKHLDFFADNWSAGFADMVYYRKLIEQARFYVSRHAGSPQADEWLKKYQSIIDMEDNI